jgi:hypothetical protein
MRNLIEGLSKSFMRIKAGDRIHITETNTVDDKRMWLHIGSPHRPVYSLKDEFIQVLQKHANERILIPMSGGIDSECIAEAALASNVDFTAITMRYIVDDKYMNDYDTQYAFDFCKDNNIKHISVDLNLNWFYETGEYIRYAIDYQCRSPQLACVLWLLDQYKDYFPVVPGDLIYARMRIVPELVPMVYLYYCYHRYFAKTGRPGIGSLMQYNPEIILSTLNIARIVYKERGSFPNDSYEDKCSALLHGGFDAKPRGKATGFEAIRMYYSDKYNEQGTMREFNNRYRKPIEDMVVEPQKVEVTLSESVQKTLNEFKKLVGDTK